MSTNGFRAKNPFQVNIPQGSSLYNRLCVVYSGRKNRQQIFQRHGRNWYCETIDFIKLAHDQRLRIQPSLFQVLPNTFKNFLNQTLRIGGTLFIVLYTYPSIALSVIPLSFVAFWVLRTFIKTSRMMRRYGYRYDEFLGLGHVKFSLP